jgi:hypothetical protein
VTLNELHVITAQARDAQTLEWVDLYATPKELTCVGTIPDPEEIRNPRLSYFTAECVVQGIVDVTAVLPAKAFLVVGDNRVFIIYTPGTDRQADDYCVFGWTGGWEPKPPYNRTFDALVFVALRGDKG